MNGPDEQTLRDVTKGSFPFQSESALQEYDRRCILSKTALVLLVATLSDPRMTFKLNWYDFKSVSSQSCQPSDAGVIDAEGCSSFECKILPNCKVVLGFFCEQVTLTESVPTRTTLRLILFQYQQTWNQLKQVSDETHPIDEMFISQLPTVSDPLPVKSLSFVEHKKKVFCVVNPHMSKQVKQIFCLHRERFVPIGGTNCRRPGLYVIGRNTVNYHQYKYEKLGRPFGFGLSEHLDLKQGAIRTKYFELVPSF